MKTMTIRVNWHQEKVSENKLVRIHDIQNHKDECRFNQMVDFTEFPDENYANSTIKGKGMKGYKRCEHCMDGKVILY
ncbi:MAG: hypothetical protein FJ128_01500 [Deltaproteobacteria bacterium]|nr:hypothetical protein [Deltaproteobacteria bacterium]